MHPIFTPKFHLVEKRDGKVVKNRFWSQTAWVPEED